MNTGMYSPKIKEDLIPYLYRLSKHTGQPMTALVNKFLENLISQFKQTGVFQEIEEEEKVIDNLTKHFNSLLKDRKKKTAEIIELLRKVA